MGEGSNWWDCVILYVFRGPSDMVVGNQLTFYVSRVRGVLMCNWYMEGWMM